MLAKSHYSGKSSVIQTAQAHKKNPIAETVIPPETKGLRK
jgi:hypothetical protein